MNSKGLRKLGLALAAVLLWDRSPAKGGTLTVNSTDDVLNFDCSVTCTLRDAAYLAQDGDTIAFAIGSGHQVITLKSGGAAVEPQHSVTIDGTTQPGYSGSPLIEINANGNTYALVLDKASTVRGLILNNPGGVSLGAGGNTISGCYLGTDLAGMTNVGGAGFVTTYSGGNIIGAPGDAGRNVISGSLVLQGGAGNVVSNNYLNVNASGTGVITGFASLLPAIDVSGDGNQIFGNLICQADPNGIGIVVNGGTGNRIYRNSIGLDVTGEVALPVAAGIEVANVSSPPTDQTLIGGVTPGDGNVIAAKLEGIWVQAGTNSVIQGNLIGTNATGSVALAGPDAIGIRIDAFGTLVGGTDPGARNVISGNRGGIIVSGGSMPLNAVIQGNYIGVDRANLHALPNTQTGIQTLSTSGETSIGGLPGAGNVIANSSEFGVLISGHNNTVKYNSIHSNGIGISLDGTDYPLANDPCDTDEGPNHWQNDPVLTSAVSDVAGNKTTVQGTLNSAPNTQFSIQFFKNTACDPSGYGQGANFLDQIVVTTDGSCNATFSRDITPFLAPGMILTATATDPNGNTSEFSACRLVVSNAPGPQVVRVDPSSASPSGGGEIRIGGAGFQPGATVKVGSLLATGVVFDDDGHLRATVPANPAGTLQDVTVTNPNMQLATFLKALFEDFDDVSPVDIFHDFVEDMFRLSITAGCGGGLFCRDFYVTRAQMAVFLVKLVHGPAFVPPPATGTLFNDVPAGSFAADFIEQLANDGLTSGCGFGAYCPDSSVTRQQMAVFLLKAIHGPVFMPPPCHVERFRDVACSSLFAEWVYELNEENYTGGCSRDPELFCPISPVTRGQMSAFIGLSYRTLWGP
jgi:hypothetical protein